MYFFRQDCSCFLFKDVLFDKKKYINFKIKGIDNKEERRINKLAYLNKILL